MANGQPNTSILVDAPRPEDAAPAAVKGDNGQGAVTPQPDDAAVPEKYRGKALADVIKMHQEAETTLGRQSNELGIQRKLVERLAEIQHTANLENAQRANSNANQPSPADVTADALLENPRAAIQAVLEQALAKELEPLKQSLATSRATSEKDKLDKDFPEWEQTVSTPDFAEYVQRSPYRLADAEAAAKRNDYAAARRLLHDFNELKGAKAPANTAASSGVAAARAIAGESPGNGVAAPAAKTYTANQLTDMMIKDPATYRSPAFQAELRKAIAEKRVTF